MLDLALSIQTMARPFAIPPGVPAERVAALRKAFMEMAGDPAFVAEAKAEHLDVALVSGGQIQDMLARISAIPKDVIRELRAIVLGAEASAAMER